MSRRSGSADQAAAMESAAEMANAGRLKQMRMVAGLVRRQDPKALPQSFQAPKGPIPRNIRQPKMPRPKAR